MAFWVAVTSLGVAITSHACKSSGREEVSLGALKACCSTHKEEGFRAEPCCTIRVQNVKLPTFRLADPIVKAPIWNALALLAVPHHDLFPLQERKPFLPTADKAPPIRNGRMHIIEFCNFLI